MDDGRTSSNTAPRPTLRPCHALLKSSSLTSGRCHRFSCCLGSGADTPLAAAAAVPAGLNGSFGGARRIYVANLRWLGSIRAGLVVALVSTTLGVLVNFANTLNRRSGFGSEFSVRRNRHVFAGGFRPQAGFANTQGPVISNATCGRGDDMASHRNLIERHGRACTSGSSAGSARSIP